jgi:hypothetical protein
MGYRSQYQVDRLKFCLRSLIRRGLNQPAPVEILFNILEVEGFAPKAMRGLDLFGKYGLWMIRDYLHRCESLDLWEINPNYARLARRLGSKVKVFCGDSIAAVRSNDPRLGKYNLIVADTPAGPFGPNYCEHFDLLPTLFTYLEPDGGLLILNFLAKLRADLDKETARLHTHRRTQFYGRDTLTPRRAMRTYERYAKDAGLDLACYCIVPRNAVVNYLGLGFRRNSALQMKNQSEFAASQEDGDQVGQAR